MRTQAGTIAVAGLLVLAGCSGFAGPSAEPTLTTPTTESEQPTTGETTTTGPISPSEVIGFQSLNASQRSAFHAAREGEVPFLPDPDAVNGSVDEKLFDTFDAHEYVRYEGELYRIEQSRTGFASYTVQSNPVDDSAENETVVPLSNVSVSFRDEVRAAITNGSYDASLGEWSSMPEPFDHYVRYENQTYSFSVSPGLAMLPAMTVVKLDGESTVSS